jgi:hypothetical protein
MLKVKHNQKAERFQNPDGKPKPEGGGERTAPTDGGEN